MPERTSGNKTPRRRRRPRFLSLLRCGGSSVQPPRSFFVVSLSPASVSAVACVAASLSSLAAAAESALCFYESPIGASFSGAAVRGIHNGNENAISPPPSPDGALTAAATCEEKGETSDRCLRDRTPLPPPRNHSRALLLSHRVRLGATVTVPRAFLAIVVTVMRCCETRASFRFPVYEKRDSICERVGECVGGLRPFPTLVRSSDG